MKPPEPALVCGPPKEAGPPTEPPGLVGEDGPFGPPKPGIDEVTPPRPWPELGSDVVCTAFGTVVPQAARHRANAIPAVAAPNRRPVKHGLRNISLICKSAELL